MEQGTDCKKLSQDCSSVFEMVRSELVKSNKVFSLFFHDKHVHGNPFQGSSRLRTLRGTCPSQCERSLLEQME